VQQTFCYIQLSHSGQPGLNTSVKGGLVVYFVLTELL